MVPLGSDAAEAGDWLDHGVRLGLLFSTSTMFAVYGYRSADAWQCAGGVVGMLAMAAAYVYAKRWTKSDGKQES